MKLTKYLFIFIAFAAILTFLIVPVSAQVGFCDLFPCTRVITVRLPKSLHEALKTEAYGRKTSMNQLCISKLLQVIDAEMVPTEDPS